MASRLEVMSVTYGQFRMSGPWLMKRNILLMSVVCVGLLTAAAGELYVVREFLALFLGFCGLFAIVAIAVFLILALEEASRGCSTGLKRTRAWLIFCILIRLLFHHHDSHEVPRGVPTGCITHSEHAVIARRA